MEKQAVSGAAIMAQLETIANGSAPGGLLLNPRPLVVYKPQPRDHTKGVAAKFHFRCTPVVTKTKDGSDWTNYEGGFFIDIAPFLEMRNVDPTFDWKWTKNEAATVKLGKPDLSAFLLGYREVREYGRAVPIAIRPIKKNPDGKWAPVAETNIIELIHKFEGGTSYVTWTLGDNRSILEIRKPNVRRSISLSLTEELQLVRYFELGLQAAMIAGI